jgi:hypothetical protein
MAVLWVDAQGQPSDLVRGRPALARYRSRAISGVRQWDLRRWTEALKVIQERPRRRLLQTVPERVRQLIAHCQAQGLSNI